eukprot:524825-Pelagomonas_calceolata.AAC.7
MDLLGLSNYGSDSEQEEEAQQEPLQAPSVTVPSISAAPDEPQPKKTPEHEAPAAPKFAGQRMELQPAQVPIIQRHACFIPTSDALLAFAGGTTRGWANKSGSWAQLPRV